MRAAILFAFLSLFFVTTQGSLWDDIKKLSQIGQKKVEHIGEQLFPSSKLSKIIEDSKHKLASTELKKDIKASMLKLQNSLMSRWTSHAATDKAVNPFDKKAMDQLIREMMAAQAKLKLGMSQALHHMSYSIAKTISKTNAPDQTMANSFSDFAHRKMSMLTRGLESILKNNGVVLNGQQMQNILHATIAAAAKGTYTEKTAVDAIKKETAANFDSTRLEKELREFREKMETEAKTELMALMKKHNLPLNMEQLKSIVKTHLTDFAGKLLSLGKMHHGKCAELVHLAKKAFTGMTEEQVKAVLPKMHHSLHLAINNHMNHMSTILKKHNLADNEHLKLVIILTHLHGLGPHRHPHGHPHGRFHDHSHGHHHDHHHDHDHDHDHDYYHGHRRLHKILKIGGITLAGAVLVVLIGVGIFVCLNMKRRSVQKSPNSHAAKESTLPYSVMDEDSRSVTKA